MGRAYNQAQRDSVKTLLEAGRDEDAIEKETGVSDRTIRRWKLELEKTGRIGKPPESRTGRHRVLNPEVEKQLFEFVRDKPEMSVDDMLWWLYDRFKIVVGTRTIRRVFERQGEVRPGFKKVGRVEKGTRDGGQYQSPYAPLAGAAPVLQQQQQDQSEMELARALGGGPAASTAHGAYPAVAPAPMNMPMAMEDDGDMPEDEETIQLQLQQIELQKREVELKLKMRRLQQGKPPASTRNSSATPSSLYKPSTKQASPAPQPKRDSRSKKKIEESRRRTAERQERMLRELERRSRRREHLTSEWVCSKDIWPLRAQSLLADLMHQYGCYAYAPNSNNGFEMVYRELYTLVDIATGDWDARVHDELLRERVKRKMSQLRSKMQKTGEILPRTDGYAGWMKADDYTGEQAGQMLGGSDDVDDPSHVDTSHLDAHAGAQDQHRHLQYDPVPDPGQAGQAGQMAYYSNAPMLHAHQQAQGYGHPGMLAYGQVPSQGMGEVPF